MSCRTRTLDASQMREAKILAPSPKNTRSLLDTACRVELPVTPTKQTTAPPATRHRMRGVPAHANRLFRAGFVPALLLLLLASTLIAAPASAKPRPSKSLTVERIYSGPSLSGHLTPGIEWSPDGKFISYLQRDGSSVEMWTMDPAKGERKLLVKAGVLEEVMQPRKASAIQSTGLGRVQAENYIWSPTGDALLFIGSSNLMLLDLKTMASKPLAVVADNAPQDVADPKFSPDGKWVSFVRDYNLWVASVATGEAKELTTGGSEEILKGQLDWLYPEELDCQTAYWWSPDSSKIAYYQMDERPVTRYPILDMSSPLGETVYTRFPQAGEANPIVRVGVVSARGGDTKWMDTGSDTDVYLPRVVWLPDSSRVAIERLNRAQTQLDLLFSDAANGATRTVLTDTDKYWINLGDDLYFFADNKRFLWTSIVEGAAFRHFEAHEVRAGRHFFEDDIRHRHSSSRSECRRPVPASVLLLRRGRGRRTLRPRRSPLPSPLP